MGAGRHAHRLHLEQERQYGNRIERIPGGVAETLAVRERRYLAPEGAP